MFDFEADKMELKMKGIFKGRSFSTKGGIVEEKLLTNPNHFVIELVG